MPAPMKMLPTTARDSPSSGRLTTNSAMPEAPMAASSDSSTVGQSYSTGTGR